MTSAFLVALLFRVYLLQLPRLWRYSRIYYTVATGPLTYLRSRSVVLPASTTWQTSVFNLSGSFQSCSKREFNTVITAEDCDSVHGESYYFGNNYENIFNGKKVKFSSA